MLTMLPMNESDARQDSPRTHQVDHVVEAEHQSGHGQRDQREVGGRRERRANAGALLLGVALGGRSAEYRSVVGLGTGQRNTSAALVVAAQNFDADVVTYLMVIAVIGLLVLMPAAGELGRRAARASSAPY